MLASVIPSWSLPRGHGCIIASVGGVERIDFQNNYTLLIHGHADPEVMQAVKNQLFSQVGVKA